MTRQALGVLELCTHSVTESDDVFVARTHSGRNDPLELREDLLLHRELLEDGLEHQVAAGEDLPVCAAGDERAEEARLALGEPAAAYEVGELVRDPGDRVVHLLLREVSQDDRNLEPPQEEERELPGHEPCTDDSHALNQPRLRLGRIRAALRAPLDEIEGVD